MANAQALKITGAPTFVVNGVKFSGARPLDFFKQIIDRLLAEQTAGPDSGKAQGDSKP
jgi:predicted DsbA family dithiol-disulfide isomerase